MASQAAEKFIPQASSAQREPSMEEILASIRRIIEDSDQVRKPELGLVDGGVAEPALRTAESDVAAGFESPADALSRVEVQAVPDPSPAIEIDTAEDEPDATGEAELSGPLEDSLQAAMEEEIESRLPPAANSAGDLDDFEPARLDQRPAIISERTGRQVAAAFGELSDAFAASRRRSFDEIAEEMMRPMLQDWLDNNLPTLVEKLVREEIERVARGAAR